MKGESDKITYPVRLRRRRLTIDKLPGMIFRILRDTFRSMAQARASEAAASIAYYGLFSLFPLVIFLVVIGSFFLEREVVQQEILDWVRAAIPASEKLVTDNFQQVLGWRGTFSVIALGGLLWSASGVFTTLVIHVNHAWPEAERRGFVRNRLVAIILVSGLITLLMLSLLLTTLFRLFLSLEIPFLSQAGLLDGRFWKDATFLLSFSASFLAAWVIYSWVPNLPVNRAATLIGALTTTVLWRVMSNAFTWFIRSGFISFELVYGSLGTIVALMTWAYLTSWITLFGAHLTAITSRRLRRYTQTSHFQPNLMARPTQRAMKQ